MGFNSGFKGLNQLGGGAFFFPMAQQLLVGQGLLIIDASQSLRRSTVARNPLDEWSARRRNLWQHTQNTHKRETSMLLAGFVPAIPASCQPRARTQVGLTAVWDDLRKRTKKKSLVPTGIRTLDRPACNFGTKYTRVLLTKPKRQATFPPHFILTITRTLLETLCLEVP